MLFIILIAQVIEISIARNQKRKNIGMFEKGVNQQKIKILISLLLPFPVSYFRHIAAIFTNVIFMLNQFVFHFLFQVSTSVF